MDPHTACQNSLAAENNLRQLALQIKTALDSNTRTGFEWALSQRPALDVTQAKAKQAAEFYDLMRGKSQVKTIQRAVFDALPPAGKSIFMRAGGRLTD